MTMMGGDESNMHEESKKELAAGRIASAVEYESSDNLKTIPKSRNPTIEINEKENICIIN
jgi:hypothetical protein